MNLYGFGKIPPPLQDLIMSKIVVVEDCWQWTGKLEKGYGRIVYKNRQRMAHVAAYEAFVGPVPNGLELDHLCRNRGCVKPSHLEPVTKRENSRRGMSAWGINARKTHCKRGHEFTDSNTRRKKLSSGLVVRLCRECSNAADRERRARRSAL